MSEEVTLAPPPPRDEYLLDPTDNIWPWHLYLCRLHAELIEELPGDEKENQDSS